MQSWASEELKDAALGDARLNRRLVKSVERWGSFGSTCYQRPAGLGAGAGPYFV
jgi:hypothetical protein